MRNWFKAMSSVLALVLFSGVVYAETGVAMLPAGGKYDDSIPKPADVFGFETGAQHVRHDQLLNYFRVLAEASDRVHLQGIGRTHEGREQVIAVISSPENIARLDQIREQHLAVTRGERQPGETPVVIWQGFSIHGDESSGSNAVSLYAWHLASSQGNDVATMLDNVVVLIDPSLNPDGMARYAAWTTSRRSEVPVTDPAHREHHQQWPSGRGNHYWFDLNRDWMLLQHPESRNRVSVWNSWRPHVVTDHHEMGADSTYFFQPGVPERTHPLTPQRNQQLTGLIAEYHARRLDAAGRLYYTEESFDDFYYGKGSTYPDITGGVGILFEQASTDGQAVETPYGVRTFAESVQNQLITAISTLEAANGLRNELRNYQAQFFKEARDKARGAWVIGDAGNPGRMQEFLKLLAGHGVRFRPLEERVESDGQTFQPGRAWVVPAGQPQARLIEALFDVRTEFKSKVFYDVSTWTLPLAFDLPFARLRGVPKVGAWHDTAPAVKGSFSPELDAVAYAFEWHDDRAPALLQALLQDEIKVLAATKPFTANTPQGEVALARGSMIVPVGIQQDRRGDIVRRLAAAASDDGLRIHAIRSGLTPKGIDLGSRSLHPLEPVKPLLVIGDGVSSYEAGEIWYVTDTRLGLPLTHVERARFGRVNLDDYTHIILVNGRFSSWDEKEAARLHEWMSAGGVLITQQSAADWATDFRLDLSGGERKRALKEAGGDFRAAVRKAKEEEKGEEDAPGRRAYANFDDDHAETLVSGAIFSTDADLTHPLAYGLNDAHLPVFKSRADALPTSANPYSTVVRFDDQPLISGYASDERTREIGGSGALLADRVGKGVLIRAAINPVFRGYWQGTQRLFVNSLYLAQAIRSTELD